MKRILCLWLPDWPAQRAREEAGGNRPPCSVILHVRDPRRGERIAVCNDLARAAGICAGMPLAEAQALAGVGQKCAALFAPYDQGADRAALAQLAVTCERYSPFVGLGEAYPLPACDPQPACDSLLLDITSIGNLFGNEQRLAETLQEDFAARGYRGHIAIADTVAAAWGLAHLAAKKPVICEAGWQALQELPIEALRLLPEHATTFRTLGIETVAHLAALPREALAARFGPHPVRQLDRAAGAVEELIVPVQPAAEFQAEWLLEHPTSDRAALQIILEQLAQRVSEALRMRDQGAVQLACRLDIAESTPRIVQIGLFRPSADARHFIELLRLQGESLRLRGAIGRVGLVAVTTARLEHRQKQLFAAALDHHSEELALLINRLSNRLGRERVVRPKLTRDAVPERAFELQPLTVAGEARPSPQRRTAAKKAARKMVGLFDNAATPPAPLRQTRPLWLLPTPTPLAVVSVAPDGPPVAFDWQGRRQRIARQWGPERIETAWWRGASVRRDYYRVETSDGQWYWMFRDLYDRQWWLHGYF